ncbi:STAS domain-containing protein [Streptomyces sp. So13.3]|uniref:STAS domain-containing protein n=1 Tax=Streptomyces TaxID=1883 RepID=UPI00164D5DA8|nr:MULTISPECIES: STAS domain-containing protein [Streptomyces]MCZ4103323.1 STAS domain-containing protein [Streptomyces sp. H39-C1]QNA71807.1 STAS domain-containing protein [Streptomyces sp. So13.3]
MEQFQVRAIGPARPGVVVLAVSGALDFGTEQLLGDAGSRALAGGCRRLVLECAGVTFCDSQGLNRFLKLRREAERGGAALVLAAISTPVRHVLELTGALPVFGLADTVDEALRAAGDADADTPGRGIPAI